MIIKRPSVGRLCAVTLVMSCIQAKIKGPIIFTFFTFFFKQLYVSDYPKDMQKICKKYIDPLNRAYVTLRLQPSAKILGFSFLLMLILASPPQIFVNKHHFWGETNSRLEGFPLTKIWYLHSFRHQKGVDTHFQKWIY